MTTAYDKCCDPWGDRFHLFGKDIILQATDIDVALLYLIGVMSIGVYGIMIGGWASNNKFTDWCTCRFSNDLVHEVPWAFH
jgi:NADH-quinone oxidoreductase subunit H